MRVVKRSLRDDAENGREREPAIPRLVGRDTECQKIVEAAKAAADGQCQRLWITGAPGTGKTALCEWAQDQMQSFSAVAGVCVEGESDLPLGVVLTIVHRLRSLVDELADPFRHRLLELVEGGGRGDLFALATSVLALVARAAEHRPVMLIVDDIQWIDSASATVLGFVMRRLDADAVLLLASSRSATVGLGMGTLAEVIEVGGLSGQAASDLLADSDVISPAVTGAIVLATGGVPLALKEVAAQLTDGQRQGVEPLPDPLPVGEHLLANYGTRLAPLEPRARLAVGVAAAAGSSLQSVPAALAALNLTAESLVPAEQANLLELTPLGPIFPHPLVRAAALASLSSGDRRMVHRALAGATPAPEERALHLVRSCTGPTEAIAEEIDAIAAELSERLGAVSAAGVWLEAARLSLPGPSRVRRLLRAGNELTLVGRVPEARQCFDEVIATSTDPLDRADAVAMWVWTRVHTSESVSAAEEAVAEAERVERFSPALALRLKSIAAACFMTNGSVKAAVKITPARPVSPTGADHEPWAVENAIFAGVLCADGRHTEAADRLHPESVLRLTETIEHDAHDAATRAAASVAANALMFLDRLDEAMALAGAGASSARRDQRPQELPLLLTTQAEIHVRTGRWQEAEALLEETIALAQQTQQIELVGYAKAILARIAGARGLAGYEQLARDALSMTTSKGVESFARHSVALGQLTIGRTDDAVRGFDRLQHLLEDLGLRSPTFVPYRADQIEAVIRGGDRQTAQRLVALFEAEVEGIESPWAEGACTRVQALLVSEGERADVLFDRSSSLLSYHPFEQARTQLVWGESLRRRRLLAASREQLQAAVTTFEHLDAVPWAERARRELRATGARTPRPKPSVLGDLTPQELQVAMTVAEGHTNRETASRLFMSPKTVEHHLSGVYRKLGLRSRSELVRLMSGAG